MQKDLVIDGELEWTLSRNVVSTDFSVISIIEFLSVVVIVDMFCRFGFKPTSSTRLNRASVPDCDVISHPDSQNKDVTLATTGIGGVWDTPARRYPWSHDELLRPWFWWRHVAWQRHEGSLRCNLSQMSWLSSLPNYKKIERSTQTQMLSKRLVLTFVSNLIFFRIHEHLYNTILTTRRSHVHRRSTVNRYMMYVSTIHDHISCHSGLAIASGE